MLSLWKIPNKYIIIETKDLAGEVLSKQLCQGLEPIDEDIQLRAQPNGKPTHKRFGKKSLFRSTVFSLLRFPLSSVCVFADQAF